MATAIRGREPRQDSGSARCAGCRVAPAATDPKPRPRYTAVPTAGRVSTLRLGAPPGPRSGSAAHPAGRLTRSSVEPIGASKQRREKHDMTTRLPDLVLGVAPARSGRPDEHAPLTNRQDHPWSER